MNDYDDLDEYSSENSFRARSNTWPLNRPDYALPSSGANIDETLPEIELEDDDLFTTNENWSTGVIDHDIMSWDPILNAQNQQQQQQQQQQKQQPPPPSPQQQQPQRQTQEANQPSTVHHHHQQPPPHQTQAQHQTRHQLPPPSSATTSTTAAATAVAAAATAQQHQHQQSVHLQLNHLHQHHQQPQLRRDPQRIAQQHRPDQPQHQHQHHQHPHQQHHQHHQHHLHHHNPQQSESFIDVAGSQGAIASSQNTAQLHHQPTQLQHQLSPQPSVQHVHQTLNSAHCLDPEDSNEYHLQQLHHLHLDNPPLAAITDAQQDQFAPTLTSLCVYNTTTNLNNDSYNISPNQNQHHLHHQQQPHHSHQHQTQHHHQHLQPLASARYDLDPQIGAIVGGEYDIKPLEDTLHQQQGHLHQPHLHHDPQLVHHQHLQRQQPQLHQHHHHQHHEQQAHPLHSQHIHQNPHQPHVSSSLDNHSSGSLLLSSSLGTSGIGLSGDLEDLDFKPNLDGASLLAHQNYDGEQPQLTSEQLGPEQPVQATDGGVGGGVGGGGGASSSGGVASDTKKSDSTSTSKVAKQNVPRRNAWGNMSYADLISQAINSTSDKRLTLSQIYDWMVQHVPYFKDKGDSNSSAGWKNSVRHNLSLHSRFKRLQNEGTGKSSWWTINPEANVGKCARRRAASMEASKYEKKRGRAKKKAEAIRQGLVSYPSLTSTSRNGSTSTLEQQPSQAPSLNQFQPTLQQPDEQVEQEAQIEQQSQAGQQLEQQLVMPSHRPQVQIQSIDQYGINRPSQQQQQHLQQLQKSDARSREELNQQNDQDIFASHQQQQQSAIQSAQQQHHHRLPEQPCYEENNDNSKLQQQQQQQQQQQSQYYYQFELSTAL